MIPHNLHFINQRMKSVTALYRIGMNVRCVPIFASVLRYSTLRLLCSFAWQQKPPSIFLGVTQSTLSQTLDDAAMSIPPHKRRPGDETTNWKASDDFMLDEENLHDQLPSVEEIRMSAASTRTRKHTGGGFGGVAIIALVAVCILALIIGLSAGLSGNSKSSGGSASVVDNPVVTNSPTSSPTMLSRMDATIALLSQITDADVSNLATPQGQAARWIAIDDGMQLEVPTTTEDADDTYDSFVERWVMAVIYYQMNGASWDIQFGWLGDTSVCDWQDSYPASDGGANRMAGIGCHNERVSDISLRKYFLTRILFITRTSYSLV